MQEHISLLTRTVLTSTLALVSLVVVAVLLSQAQPEQNYTSEKTSLSEEVIVPVLDEKVGEEKIVDEMEKEEEAVVGSPEPLEESTVTPEESQQTTQTIALQTQTSFYDVPPIPLDAANIMTLPALVNILCGSNPGSTIKGATGSGVVIDPRGVILTNAHVAQYLLLENHPDAPVSCVIRTGAPAETKYKAEVIAFPTKWAVKHAKDLRLELPTGTGEHDWALLYISGTTNGSPKPQTFSFVPSDTREGVTKTNDSVLLASYPAGFLGGATIRKNLWPVSTVVSIQKVYTFTESIIDILALGGNIAAQGGSSGGAVVNQWGKLVGIISTSSLGETTAERDLRAVSLSHINRSMQENLSTDLLSFLLSGNFEQKVTVFKNNSLPHLLQEFPF